MTEEHEHYCPRCKQKYSCTDERPIDASSHGGPDDSVCFHHYGVPHVSCAPTNKETVVIGGY